MRVGWEGRLLTTYETDRIRKRARSLYLELRALGLDLYVEECYGGDYVMTLCGKESLLPAHADRLQRRIDEATPGLLWVLWCKGDENLEAIRKEALL